MKATYILASIALCCCMAATAQETELKRNVEVVNTYLPTISNPQKMHRSPILDDTMSYKPTFRYSILNKVSSVKTMPDSIRVAAMNFPRERTIYKSMVKGGAGNAVGYGEYFYNIGASQPYQLSLNLGHQTAFGKVKLDNDEKVKAPFSDTWAGVDFGYFFRNYTLGTNLNFAHNMYQYYGMEGLSNTLLPISNVDTIKKYNQLFDKKQRLTDFNAEVSLINRNPDDKFNFETKIGFGLFSNKTGVRETDFSLKAKVHIPILDDDYIGVKFELNTNPTSVPSDNSRYTFTKRKHTDIQISPYFESRYEYGKAILGLNIISEIESEKDNMLLQPELLADLNIAEGIVYMYAALTSNYKANSYKEMVKENPFISPDVNVHSSNQPIIVSGGLRARFSNVVTLSANAEYGTYENEHFWINREVTVGPHLTYLNRFDALIDDGKLFKAHGELNITPGSRSQILLTGTYYNWDNNYTKAYGKPQYEIGINTRFFATQKLLISGNANIIGQKDVKLSIGDRKLDMVYDINIEGEYFINSRWSAYLRVNNVAACKYALYYGYNVHSINAIGGITFKF